MKHKRLLSFGNPFAPAAGIVGLMLLLGVSASAQNLLKNGDFESPFPVADPTAGWAVVFPGGPDGGPGDWAIAGRTLAASRVSGGHGAHLRPNNWGTTHAYFKQVVTNLTAGATYTLTIERMRAQFANYIGGGTQRIYLSAVSGSSSNVVFGNADSNGPYSLSITCSATRQIEVQLHNWKRWMSNENAEDMKHAKCSAWFDDCSLTLTP
jgi:hypothetical protein